MKTDDFSITSIRLFLLGVLVTLGSCTEKISDKEPTKKEENLSEISGYPIAGTNQTSLNNYTTLNSLLNNRAYKITAIWIRGWQNTRIS